MEDKNLVHYENLNYSKSNMLISSKFRSNILENKITAISLYRIQSAVENSDHSLETNIPVSEIMRLCDIKKGGSFYSKLKDTAQLMTGKVIGMENPENDEFTYLSLVIKASCKNGIFSIRYNPELIDYFKSKKSFTILDISIVTKFRSVYSFRLYEILKSRSYLPKGVNSNNKGFRIQYDLAELKLLLGIIDASNPEIRKELEGSKYPNYEKACDIIVPDGVMAWRDVKRRCLDVAVKEINEISDMHLEYELIKSGRGGTVVGIAFLVEMKKEAVDEQESAPVVDELTQEDKYFIADQVIEIIDEKIRISDAIQIADMAKFDVEKVRKAYDVAKKSTKKIDNIVAFMLAAIKNQYDIPKEKKSASKKPENSKKSGKSFNNFKGREYDMDDLEKQLLNVDKKNTTV